MVTNPTDGHTLLVKGGAKINFNNCMVQVNTAELGCRRVARYLLYPFHQRLELLCRRHPLWRCRPPKDPTCTFFTDPFASYIVPVNTCTYTNKW